MDSDPAAVSRQGRQVREEAAAWPPAAWRPLRALREKFFEKRPENRKMSGFSPKIAIFGPKRSENGVFMRFLTIFRLRDPLRLVSVDDFLPEA